MSSCKQYFILADQYYESSKTLMNTIIENNNINYGIGDTQEEADLIKRNSIIKSDAYLFIPSLFLSMQSIELFLKGILLMNNVEIEYEHEINNLIELLEAHVNNKELVSSFKKYYKFNTKIIKEYKKNNRITTTNELYMSLRYPEDLKHKKYNYIDLKYKGSDVLSQYKKIIELMGNIKNNILLEYNKFDY